jgi:hypothetical protein
MNLKGYGEFDNNARPDGWNLWRAFAGRPIFTAADADQVAAKLSRCGRRRSRSLPRSDLITLFGYSRNLARRRAQFGHDILFALRGGQR